MKRLFLSSTVVCLFFLALTTSCSKNNSVQENLMCTLNENWTFAASTDTIWRTATVPGTVQQDLMTHGIIPDPFIGDNEQKIQWVGYKDWSYQTRFDVSDTMLQRNNLKLIFKGLDTYADVYLNDSLILSSDNMFICHEIACKQLLKAQNNILLIKFKSPFVHTLPYWSTHSTKLPSISEQNVADTMVSMYVRKAPYHFGWDWGPRILTMGIWQPIELMAWNDVELTDVALSATHVSEKSATLSVQTEINATSNADVDVVISIPEAGIEKKINQKIVQGKNIIASQFDISNPKLWWSNGLGEAHLYKIDVKIQQSGTTIASKTFQYGIRDLQLIRTKDEAGETFYFQLNGVPVFAKGSNYIPLDNFIPRVTNQQYATLLDQAVKANMNCLRVWGGAIYENDVFYQLCDEKGIIVWQDFMFSCAFYPGDSKFLASVTTEVEQQVKRLRNYACIGLWCGNNEIEYGWKNFGWSTRYTVEDSLMFFQAYDTIAYHILPKAIKDYDPQKAYWASSPMSSKYKPSSNLSGDEHSWRPWFGAKSFDYFWQAPPRFSSEYGFQSFPEMRTIQYFADEKDFDTHSPIMKQRQKSPMKWIRKDYTGTDNILWYMNQYYNQPKTFDNIVYVSQLMQAMGVETAIEAHRANKPYCMGSLYWQINDCWPVISWASIDYFGRWKAMHYAARKANSHVAAPLRVTEDSLWLYATSDLQKPQEITVRLSIKNFTGDTLQQFSRKVTVKNEKSILIEHFSTKDLIADNLKPNTLIHISVLNANGEIVYEDVDYFTKPMSLQLKKPTINSVVTKSENVYVILLSTNTLVKNIYLDFPTCEGFFSDNFFDLLPGASKEIVFTPKNEADSVGVLKIKSLIDSYQ